MGPIFMSYGVWDKGQCPRKVCSMESVDAILTILSSTFLEGKDITELLGHSTPRGSGWPSCLPQKALGKWRGNHKEKLPRKRMI